MRLIPGFPQSSSPVLYAGFRALDLPSALFKRLGSSLHKSVDKPTEVIGWLLPKRIVSFAVYGGLLELGKQGVAEQEESRVYMRISSCCEVRKRSMQPDSLKVTSCMLSGSARQ